MFIKNTSFGHTVQRIILNWCILCQNKMMIQPHESDLVFNKCIISLKRSIPLLWLLHTSSSWPSICVQFTSMRWKLFVIIDSNSVRLKCRFRFSQLSWSWIVNFPSEYLHFKGKRCFKRFNVRKDQKCCR